MDTLLFKIEVQGLSDQVREIGRLKLELESLSQRKKDLKKQYDEGKISVDNYQRQIGELELKIKANKLQTQELQRATQATATAFKGAEGSMVRLAQELGFNREKYRALSQAERENVDVGGKLLATIQKQDAEIKRLDASIGNHQRNVGHYEKALSGLEGILARLPLGNVTQVFQSMVSSTQNLISVANEAGEAQGLLNKSWMIGVGAIGAVVAVGATLVSFLGEASEEAMKEEKANNRLLFALEGNIEAYDRMTSYKEKLLETTTFTKDELNAALNYSLSMGRTEEQTRKLMTASMGLSKVTGDDLMTSMTKIMPTYEGVIGRLARYEGSIKDMSEEQLRAGAAVDALAAKFEKFATTGLSSTLGMQAQTKKYWNEIKEQIGFVVLPVVHSLAGAWLGVTNTIKEFVKGSPVPELKKEWLAQSDLVMKIQQAAVGTKERNTLIDELRQKYPSLLGNLSNESVSNQVLADALKMVNNEYLEKIRLQQSEERFNEVAEKQAKALDGLSKARTNMNTTLAVSMDLLYKANAPAAKLVEQAVTIDEKIMLVKKHFGGAGGTGVAFLVAAEQARKFETEVTRAKEKYVNVSTEVSRQAYEDAMNLTGDLKNVSTQLLETYYNYLSKKATVTQDTKNAYKFSLEEQKAFQELQLELTSRKEENVTVKIGLSKSEQEAKDKADAEVQAMLDGVEKEKEIVRNKYYDIRVQTEKESTEADKEMQTKKEKAEKEATEFQKRLGENVKANAEYILKITTQSLDAEVQAMLDGVEKEKEIVRNKYYDIRVQTEKESTEKVAVITDEITNIEKSMTALEKKQNLTGKLTKEETQLYTDLQTRYIELSSQKEEITKSVNEFILKNEKALQQELVNVDKKYSVIYKDEVLQKKYEEDVRVAEEEGRLKIDIIENLLKSETTLTTTEKKKLELEEKKIMLSVFQKKYDLLYAEIQARKILGTVTEEQYQAELVNIGKLYTEIRQLQSDIGIDSEGEQKGDRITNWFAKTFGIEDSEAAAIVNKTWELVNALTNLWLEGQQQRIQAELAAEKKKLDTSQKRELADLESRKKKGLINEEQYQAEKAAIDEKYKAKATELERVAFEKNKKNQIAMVWINAAVAAIKDLSQYGFIIGGIMAALDLIFAGIQTAIINRQTFTGAKGGVLEGKSHAEGGITFKSKDTNIELEGGEAVINKQSMTLNEIIRAEGTPRQIASALNSLHGYGVKFETGGMVQLPKFAIGVAPVPVPSGIQQISQVDMERITDRIIAGITAGVNDKKVYVVESDITETQRKVKVIENNSTW